MVSDSFEMNETVVTIEEGRNNKLKKRLRIIE